MLAILFWLAVGCILHTYVLYPLLLIVLDAVGQARGAWSYLSGNERRRPPAQIGLPAVSVLIAAYNEAECIGRRIENLLEQDYPADKLEILVGCDASSDETVGLVCGRLRLHSPLGAPVARARTGSSRACSNCTNRAAPA